MISEDLTKAVITEKRTVIAIRGRLDDIIVELEKLHADYSQLGVDPALDVLRDTEEQLIDYYRHLEALVPDPEY